MRKLAMLRSERFDPCPYGLPIPFGCRNAGDAIKTFTLLEDGANPQDNIDKLNQLPTKEQCAFNQLNAGEFTDCSAPHNTHEKTFPSGSPKFYRPMAGAGGLEGLTTLPLGYYNDNSIDQGTYYGNFSIESVASSKNHGLNSHSIDFLKGLLSMPNKTAQEHNTSNLDGFYIDPAELDKFLNPEKALEDSGDLQVAIEIAPEDQHEEAFLSSEPEIEGDIEISSDEGQAEKHFEFKLPPVPGAEDQSEIEEPEEIEVEEEEDDLDIKDDPWKWKVENFLDWWDERMNSIPKHSGREIAGCERAIAYLKHCLKEAQKASRMDIDNKIDIDKLESATDEAHKGIENLENRIEKLEKTKRPKKKKKADLEDNGLVKEARMPNFQVNVSLFISHIARIIINSTVSSGKDAVDTFRHLVKKYDLTKREQAEVVRLLEDCGFITYVDFGKYGDEFIDITSEQNYEWSANRYN